MGILLQLLFNVNGNWDPNIDNYSLQYMMIGNETEVAINQYEPNMTRQLVAILLLIIGYFHNLTLSYLEVFNLLVIIAMYEITCEMHSVFFKREKVKTQILLLHYADMWDHFTRINYINSGILLVVYLQIISWVSSTALDFLQDENWFNRIYMFLHCVLYSSMFILAAEVNHKVREM